jgi:hypothetical protein
MPSRVALVALTILGALLLGCGDGRERAAADGPAQRQGREPRQTPGQESERGPIRTAIRGVHLRVDEEVVLEIRGLTGTLEPTRPGEVPFFDDPESFRIRIEGAEVAMSPESLAGLLNRHVFAYEGAPLSDLTVELTEDGGVRQSATLNKAGGVPITLTGRLSATPEGDVKLQPEEMTAAGLPVERLLDLLGIEISDLINTREERGVRIEEDNVILDPERALPPPRIRGRVSAVRVEGGKIVQVFGAGPAREPRAPVADRGHLFFLGGVLRFGKLTMRPADLEIADADPSDPFEFYQRRYQEQLVAGYSKTLQDQGLVSYMPDYAEVAK